MKKFLYFFTLTTLAINTCNANYYTLQDFFYADIAVNENDSAFADNSEIMSPIKITNHGTFYGNVYINSPMEFAVRNDGDMTATFNLANGSTLTQYISNYPELNKLNVIGGTYNAIIMTDFSGSVYASDLINLNASKIIIDKTNLNMSATVPELNNLASILDINGSINFTILNYNNETLPTFNGYVSYIMPTTNNPMYVYKISGGQIHLARNTNYTAFLGQNDKKAVFLDNLRLSNPGDKMLLKMDSAKNMNELNDIMNKSMMFNPNVLNQNIMKMITSPDFNFNYQNYLGLRTLLNSGVMGSSIYLNYSFMNLNFITGSLKENDDYKWGDGNFYGAGLKLNFAPFSFGAKFINADWKNIEIMSDNLLKNNAKSQLFYSFLEFSPDFNYFAPIVRLNYEDQKTVEYEDTSFYLSYGGKVYLTDDMNGIVETCGLYAIEQKDNLNVGLIADWYMKNDGFAISASASVDNLHIEIRSIF